MVHLDRSLQRQSNRLHASSMGLHSRLTWMDAPWTDALTSMGVNSWNLNRCALQRYTNLDGSTQPTNLNGCTPHRYTNLNRSTQHTKLNGTLCRCTNLNGSTQPINLNGTPCADALTKMFAPCSDALTRVALQNPPLTVPEWIHPIQMH